MRPSTILTDANRRLIQELAVHHNCRNPRVFGSVARGEDIEASDLDILIDATDDTDLFDLAGLRIALKEALGVEVDVRTLGELPEKAHAQVLKEAKPV